MAIGDKRFFYLVAGGLISILIGALIALASLLIGELLNWQAPKYMSNPVLLTTLLWLSITVYLLWRPMTKSIEGFAIATKMSTIREFAINGVNGKLTIEEDSQFGPVVMSDGRYGVVFIQNTFNPEGYFWGCLDIDDAFKKFDDIKEALSESAQILIKETDSLNWHTINDISDTTQVV